MIETWNMERNDIFSFLSCTMYTFRWGKSNQLSPSYLFAFPSFFRYIGRQQYFIGIGTEVFPICATSCLRRLHTGAWYHVSLKAKTVKTGVLQNLQAGRTAGYRGKMFGSYGNVNRGGALHYDKCSYLLWIEAVRRLPKSAWLKHWKIKRFMINIT